MFANESFTATHFARDNFVFSWDKMVDDAFYVMWYKYINSNPAPEDDKTLMINQ